MINAKSVKYEGWRSHCLKVGKKWSLINLTHYCFPFVREETKMLSPVGSVEPQKWRQHRCFKFYRVHLFYTFEMIRTLQIFFLAPQIYFPHKYGEMICKREGLISLLQMLICHISNSLEDPFVLYLNELTGIHVKKTAQHFFLTINSTIFLITEWLRSLNAFFHGFNFLWTFHDFNRNNIYIAYISKLGE